MKPSHRVFSLWISLLFLSCQGLWAQAAFPSSEGERVRYAVQIEFARGYISGVCILLYDGLDVRGSLFNEFGISVMDFSYRPAKDKVKLHSVQKMLDKWYIRKRLRRDLREVIHVLQQGGTQYTDEKYHIRFRFTPMGEEQETVHAK